MNRFAIYALAALVLIADQLSKLQIVRTLPPDKVVNVLPGFFDLTLVHNTGGAFGILPNSTLWLVAAALAAALAIVWYTIRAKQPMPLLLSIALALPLGGAIGNLVDRVRLKYVVDFLHAHAGNRLEWPVFNVADSCICIGVGLLAIYFWRTPGGSTAPAATPDEPEKETV